MADLNLGIGLNIDWSSVEKVWAERAKQFSEQHKIDLKVDTKSAQDLSKFAAAYEKIIQAQTQSSILQERLDGQIQLTAKRRASATMEHARNEMQLTMLYERQLQAEAKTANSSLILSEKLNQAKRQSAILQERLAGQTVSTTNKQNANLRAQELHEQRLAAAKFRTQAAEQSLNKARSNSVGIIESQNRALQQQGFMLNGLKQFAGQYLSILGAWRLFDNIRKTTADFEMQRVALRAIIQDVQSADRIFAQTLNLAIQSPFTALNLISYTKQLAAYRIETENLFETTRRLADVSAGLGVDMSRLIIAYGQVRAASVLRGQEIRQFTEAGIPLIALLADKFTELKGRVVDTAEVFDLVSRRQVPFEMVAEIFEDMTNKGGTFYNMQAIQAKTLQGIYANLSDNIQQAFSRIGNSQMGILKGTGLLLTELAQNLETVVNVGLKGVAMWALYRQGLGSVARSIGGIHKAEITSAMTTKEKNAQLLQQAGLYRVLNAEEQALIANRRRLTIEDIKSLGISKNARAELTMRAFAMGKLSEAEFAHALQLGVINDQQFASIKNLTAGERAALKQKIAMQGLTASWKSFFTTLLRNPMTWVFAALSVGYSVISKIIQRNKEYADSVKAVRDTVAKSNKDIADSYASAQEVIGAGLEEGASAGAMKRTADAFDSLLEKNKDLAPIVKERIKDISDERLKLLELKEVWDEINAAASQPAQPDLLPNAVRSTANMPGRWNPFAGSKDVNDYFSSVNKQIDRLNKKITDANAKGREWAEGIYEDWLRIAEGARTGQIPIGQLINEINALRSGMSNANQAKFDKLIGELWGLRSAMSRVSQYIEAGFLEFDGQKVNLGNPERYGLTEKGYTEFQKWGIQHREGYIAGLTDEQKGDEAMIRAAWGKILGIVEDMTPTPSLPDAFTGWKRILSENNVFDSTAIRDMNNFQDAAEKTAKKLQDLRAEESRLQTSLNAEPQGTDLYDTWATELSNVQTEIIGVDRALKQMHATDLLTSKSGSSGAGRDTRLQTLKEELKVIQDAYKEYQNFQRLMSDEQAQSRIHSQFRDVFASFQQLRGFEPEFSEEGVVSAMERALDLAKGYLDNKTVIQIKAEIADINNGKLQKDIQRELDAIARRIDIAQDFSSLAGSLRQAGATDAEMEVMLGGKVDASSLREAMEKEIQKMLAVEDESWDFNLPTEALMRQLEEWGDTLNSATRKQIEAYLKYLDEAKRNVYLGLVELTRFELPEGENIVFDFSKVITKSNNALEEMTRTLSQVIDMEDVLRRQMESLPEGSAERVQAEATYNHLLSMRLSAQEAIRQKESVNYKESMKEIQGLGNAFIKQQMEVRGLGDAYSSMGEATRSQILAIREELMGLTSDLISIGEENEGGLLGSLLDVVGLEDQFEYLQSLFSGLTANAGLDGFMSKLDDVNTAVEGIADEAVRSKLMQVIALLREYGSALNNANQGSADAAIKLTIRELKDLENSISGVIDGVQSIFETFNVGVDTVAGKSLNVLKTITNGVMQAMQIAAEASARALSTVEKASVILAIIGVALQIMNAIAEAVDNTAALEKKIASLQSQIEFLRSMYDKLNAETFYDPKALDGLQKELNLRYEMLGVLKRQSAACPTCSKMRGSLQTPTGYCYSRRALWLQMT